MKVGIVGLPNAGKSTLFSALTRARTEISPQLFMTLDPLVRRMRVGHGKDVLLVDTVGFIQKLPHALVAAFRATLEEVVEADLLLHVMDASAEDFDEREAAVDAVLREIGAADRPRIAVLNKADKVAAMRLVALQSADTPFPEPLTYTLPAELQEQVVFGSTLLVPLGSRELIGAAVGFPEEAPPDLTLRPIRALLDPAPAFDERLYRVAVWMAGRYRCSLGEALHREHLV